MAWYVANVNKIGQPSWTMYGSEEEFREFYKGCMRDGSGDLVRDVYPQILYQGENQEECQLAWEKAHQELISDPDKTRRAIIGEMDEMYIDRSESSTDLTDRLN